MRRRAGFTITELLVSMALIVFIMAILAEAFVEGLKTFRNMKAIGDLNSRLRMVSSMLRDDLINDHFEGKRRLSDPGFWNYGPPQEGYFRVWHGSTFPSATFFTEGNADGIESYNATDHYLQFTSKKRGNNRQDFYSGTVLAGSPLLSLGTPDSRYQEAVANVYNSQWAEVAWFLRSNGATAGNGNQPLFTLYRRQRVVVPTTITTDANGNLIDLNYQAPGARPLSEKPYYLEVSTSISSQNNLFFNSPRDLTIPERRFGMNSTSGTAGVPYRSDKALRYPIFALNIAPTYISPNWQPDDEDGPAALAGNKSLSFEGTDVILTDVISFAVIPIFSGQPSENIANQNPYLTKYFPGVGVFDTWSNRADDLYNYTLWSNSDVIPPDIPDARLVPNTSVLTGVQISIRVWDAKTNQARQVTIIQDL